jgi:hypothetical protein
MSKINLAFMLDAIDRGGLDDIVNFFKINHDIDDIVVFSKDPLLATVDSSYGVLSLYYFKFYQGYVVFFRLEDYLEYQDYSLSKNIYLYLGDGTIENIETIDRNMLKNISILTKNKTSNTVKPLTLRFPV